MIPTLVLATILLAPQVEPDTDPIPSVRRRPAAEPRQDEPARPPRPEKVDPVLPPEPGPDAAPGRLSRVAERPSDTWSPLVVGSGTFLVEAGLAFHSEDGENGSASVFRGPALVRYGLADSLELLATGDVFISRSGDDPNTGDDSDGFGLGDVALGAKWGLLQEDGTYPAFGAIAYWKLPTADDEDGLGSGEGDLYFIAAAGKTFENVTAYVNLGLAFISDVEENDRFLLRRIASVEIRVALDDSFTVIGELGWLSGIEPQAGTDTAARVGVAYLLSEIVRLDASAKLGLSEDADDFAIMGGVAFMLGSF